MALEDLLGDVYRTNQQLPLSYGGMFNNQFSPYYAFIAQQQQRLAENQGNVGQAGISGATSLGNAGLGLYGNLAGMRQQQQQFNSVAPVLGALLNQFGGAGFNLPAISPIGDPMAGYGSAFGGALQQLANAQNRAYSENRDASQSFGQQFGDVFNRQAGMMPRMAGGFTPQIGGPFDDETPISSPGFPTPPPGPGGPYMHGGHMTGGGHIGPGQPKQGGDMFFAGGNPNFDERTGTFRNPPPPGNPFASPANQQPHSPPAPQQTPAPSQGWYGQQTPYGTNPGQDDVVQWEMNRLRAEQSGGNAPAGLSYWSQTPQGAWQQKGVSPNLSQQDEARKRLGRQFMQEHELRKYAPPKPQPQPQPQSQPQPQFGFTRRAQ